jgi:hypothetical protein
VPDAVRDRQADEEDVGKDALDEVAQRSRPHEVQRRERQHHDLHEKVDGDPEEQPAHEWEFAQERQLESRGVVHRCRGDRDEEVQEDAEQPSACTSLHGAWPENATRDGAWDTPSKVDECRDEIERAGEEAAYENRCEASGAEPGLH